MVVVQFLTYACFLIFISVVVIFLQYGEWAALGTYQRDALETRTSTSAGSFESEDLIDLQSDLIEAYQAGAVWVMNRKTFAEVMKLRSDSGNGDFLLNPRVLSEGARLTLLGAPVRYMSDMPNAGSLTKGRTGF